MTAAKEVDVVEASGDAMDERVSVTGVVVDERVGVGPDEVLEDVEEVMEDVELVVVAEEKLAEVKQLSIDVVTGD